MLELGLKTLIGYLLGSVVGALLVGRFRGVDIRSMGSGNAGGTNALRTQGFGFAVATVVVDVGKGAATRYRLARDEELLAREELGRHALIHALVYRLGPIALCTLAARTGLSEVTLAPVLLALVERGAIEQNGESYSARDFSVPLGASAGWEAAVFDHVQAVVQAIVQRLAGENDKAAGGSTYTFDVWDGHPMAAEVEGALAKFRLFLSQQRGQPEVPLPSLCPDQSHYCAGFPDWLMETLSHYQRLMQRQWRPGHLDKQLLSFWNSHTHL